mmetsp:Transcript_19428/g.42507  ORF Transcript_19428/g.42507 Transcript_19428/m.42507 type:complete len:217 (-) Transcript_19428:183-833(-)
MIAGSSTVRRSLYDKHQVRASRPLCHSKTGHARPSIVFMSCNLPISLCTILPWIFSAVSSRSFKTLRILSSGSRCEDHPSRTNAVVTTASSSVETRTWWRRTVSRHSETPSVTILPASCIKRIWEKTSPMSETKSGASHPLSENFSSSVATLVPSISAIALKKSTMCSLYVVESSITIPASSSTSLGRISEPHSWLGCHHGSSSRLTSRLPGWRSA